MSDIKKKKYITVEELVGSVIQKDLDLMIASGYPSLRIANLLMDTHAVIVPVDLIDTYIAKVTNPRIKAIHKVTTNIDADLQPANNGEELAAYFGFSKTTADLDMVYERIRDLHSEAKNNPGVGGYDGRIIKYLDLAERIRMRVFKFQYENVRRAILSTVGKKIVLAAVAVFIPYIPEKNKAKVMGDFEAAIRPILADKDAPEIPSDICEIRDAV